MTDQEIIHILQTNKRDKGLQRLYRYYPQVEKLIRSKGGSKQDAQDMFQEALIVFCGKVKQEDFKLTASLDTYLYSISRLLWSNASRKHKKSQSTVLSVDPADEGDADWQEAIEREERIKLAEEAVSELGQRCWEMLRRFYHESMSMREIAKISGFKSEKIAKNQKYKCLEVARHKFRQKRAQLPIEPLTARP